MDWMILLDVTRITNIIIPHSTNTIFGPYNSVYNDDKALWPWRYRRQTLNGFAEIFTFFLAQWLIPHLIFLFYSPLTGSFLLSGTFYFTLFPTHMRMIFGGGTAESYRTQPLCPEMPGGQRLLIFAIKFQFKEVYPLFENQICSGGKIFLFFFFGGMEPLVTLRFCMQNTFVIMVSNFINYWWRMQLLSIVIKSKN